MKKVVLTFGLISGTIVVTMMLATFGLKQDQTNFKMAEIIGYTSMIVSLSMVFFGIRSYRNTYQQGVISFGKAFQVGLYITLIASCMYVAGWMIYSHTAGTEVMKAYFEHSMKEVRNSDLPQAEIDTKITEIENFRELYKNPLIQIGMTFLEILPVGLLVTLICAAVLRRQEPKPLTV